MFNQLEGYRDYFSAIMVEFLVNTQYFKFKFDCITKTRLKTRGVKPLILSLSMVLKKNTAESKIVPQEPEEILY